MADPMETAITLQISSLTRARRSLWERLSIKRRKAHSYVLMLAETGGAGRHMPVLIGEFEAQAIAIVLEMLQPARPLAHDLFKAAVGKFGYALDHVLINAVNEDGVFYTLMQYSKGEEKVMLDARLSDAIALALRHDSPVYIDKAVFDKYIIAIG